MAEPDTKELDALLYSLNGSAERFQTLWFSFLGLTLYLAIAALATTHRNLLLGEPQTLPLLNIRVELLPFYIIAPLLYFVFHFYLLMMLMLLAGTAAPVREATEGHAAGRRWSGTLPGEGRKRALSATPSRDERSGLASTASCSRQSRSSPSCSRRWRHLSSCR